MIINGDSNQIVAAMKADSIHCVITSPPYYGLRNYQVEGQLGLEKTPEEYVQKMTEIFREVRRVLRKDGTCWLNLGDSYNGGGTHHGTKNIGLSNSHIRQQFEGTTKVDGLKPKDLIGIPWRVAFALQADGWYLRQDIIWHKPNPMPESVTDRCTKAHEYVFLLTKSARYWYDAEAVRNEPTGRIDPMRFWKKDNTASATIEGRRNDGGRVYAKMGTKGANKRSVWTVTTQPFKGAHFATFPPKLITPMVLAGCPDKCCPDCGAGWVRIVQLGDKPPPECYTKTTKPPEANVKRIGKTKVGMGQKYQEWRNANPDTTLAWQPSCKCGSKENKPGVILDPFAGAGTTGLVAMQNDREFIGIELNYNYCRIAEARIRHHDFMHHGMFAGLTN